MPNPTPKVTIPVPLSGGVNTGVEPYLLPPPYAALARNMVMRETGSLRKLPGATWANLTPADAGVLFSDPHGALLFAGLNGLRHLGTSGTAWRTQDPQTGFNPVNVSLQAVLSLSGEVAQATVCHNQGYTAVACSTRKSPALDDYTTVWAIVDGTGDVVGGPYIEDSVDIFPRIEPITVSGNPTFVFFGLQGTPGAGAPNFTLRTAQVRADIPPATITWSNIGTINRGSDTTAEAAGYQKADTTVRILYDTHAYYTHDKAYVCFYDGTNLVVRRTDGSTTDAAVTVVAGAPTAFAVFHDKASETVLVYGRAATSVYYANSAVSSFTAVAGAINAQHPVWYKSVSGVYIDGMLVTLTGSNPATPSFSGSRAHTPPGKTFDPQGLLSTAWGDASTLFFQHESGGVSESAGFEDLRDQSWVDAVLLSGGKGITVSPLLQTRHLRRVESGTHQEPTLAYALFVQPQSSADASGRVYVPYIVRTPAAPHLPIVDDGDGRGPFDGYQPNHDRTVGFAVLSVIQTELQWSQVPHQDSLLVAAGNVLGWDGKSSFDLMAPPRIMGYDDSAALPGGSVEIDREDIGDSENRGLHGSVTRNYAHVGWWSMKAVLVYTDRNGIEWRSAPSPPFNINSIDGVASDPCPLVEVDLDASHQRMYEAGGSFDVELYVTERDDGLFGLTTTAVGAASEAAIVKEYYLAQRSPLLFNGTNGIDYYVIDLLQSSFQGGTATGSVSLPLYTDQGELAPVRPPASHVLAGAGNYLFLVPSEFPFELWPSKPLERGRGPEFAPEVILPAPSGGGQIISLAGQGDRLVVLCQHGVWELFVGAQGIDANGGGGFGQYRQLHAGDGCVSHKGVCSTPFGVFYVANSGPKMVRPDGSVEDIGSAVSGLVDPTLLYQATYHEDADEVWLAHTTGTLIYSLRSNGWTTSDEVFTSMIYHRGKFYRQGDTNRIEYEAPSQPYIGEETVLAKYVSPWLSFESPSGWKRCRDIAVLGRYISSLGDGGIRVRVAYNYIDTDIDLSEVTGVAISNLERKFQLNIKPSRQKFDSIRITVEEYATLNGEASVSNLIWALVSISLELSTKTGTIKLQQGASGTTSITG